jgi:hypothetical protein
MGTKQLISPARQRSYTSVSSGNKYNAMDVAALDHLPYSSELPLYIL